MVSAVRRRMQEGVDVTRGLKSAITARMAPDYVVIAQASAIRDRASDLASGIVVPKAGDIARVQSRIRTVIASLTTDQVAVDKTTIEATRNGVTKEILQQQCGEINLLHLLDAVLAGVEQGLRDLVRSHGSRKTGSDASPSPEAKPPHEDLKTGAPLPAPPREPPAPHRHTSPRATGGPMRTPEDTPNI